MFVTIRSYNSQKKAEYIKYRIERAGIECKTGPIEDGNKETEKSYKIDVPAEQVKDAVEELFKVKTEYPDEDFELETDPNGLMHILVPIDFSEKSIEACKYALDIATRRPIEIKFLHVWNDELDDSVAVRNSYMLEDFKRMQRNELKRDINNHLAKFMNNFHKLVSESNTQNNLLYHFTIAEGMIQRQIEEAAKKYNPQLIILAHNDNKDWKFRISRDVANHTIDLAFCPVYYIPQKVYYKPIQELHIMYATNFDINDMQTFQLIQELSVGYNTHIYCLHVVHEGIGILEQEEMKKLIEQMENSKSRDISIHQEVINNAKLLNGFKDYIEENQINMVSFTSPEHSVWHKLFNPDNLRTVMKGSTLPLLIFRYK